MDEFDMNKKLNFKEKFEIIKKIDLKKKIEKHKKEIGLSIVLVIYAFAFYFVISRCLFDLSFRIKIPVFFLGLFIVIEPFLPKKKNKKKIPSIYRRNFQYNPKEISISKRLQINYSKEYNNRKIANI